MIRVERSRDKGGFLLPETFPIAIVMADTRKNSATLAEIRETLADGGIHLDAWVTERDGHLYNWRGREVFEPIFDKMYLKRLAKGMFRLSGRVFGQSHFSYDDLGAEIGDPSTERVRAQSAASRSPAVPSS